MEPAKFLPLQQLTLKVGVLLLLLSGQRGPTVWLLGTWNRMVSNREVHCVAGFLLKTTTPTHHQRELVLSPYSPDRKLSIVTSLRACLEGTKVLCQGETRLLISFKKPHKCILRDTLRRWMKTVLDLANIRMDVFTPHSTRVASTTKVVDKIPLKTLLQTTSW